MRVSVQVLTYKEGVFSLEIEPSDTIESVKRKITSQQGHTFYSQRLEFAGQSLDNNWNVYHYDIEEGSLIYLVLRYRGSSRYIPRDLRMLPFNHYGNKMICRKCYARMPPDATHCRKKKCHSNDLRPRKLGLFWYF